MRKQLSVLLGLSLAAACGGQSDDGSAPAPDDVAEHSPGDDSPSAPSGKNDKFFGELGNKLRATNLLKQLELGRSQKVLVTIDQNLKQITDKGRATFSRALDVLATRLDSRMRVVDVFTHVPYLVVEVASKEELKELLAQKEVVRVFENVKHYPAMVNALDLINQPEVLLAGDDGSGATSADDSLVANLDTGLDYGLNTGLFGDCTPASTGACIGSVDVNTDVVASDGGVVPDGADDGEDDASSTRHGTKTAAIIAKVAPGAKIISLDVFRDTTADSADIVKALDWVLDYNATNSAGEPDINVVNVESVSGTGSLSPTDCGTNADEEDQDATAAAIEAVLAADIVVTSPTGNNNTPNIAAPACVSGVLAVAAVYGTTVTSSLQYPTAAAPESGFGTCRDDYDPVAVPAKLGTLQGKPACFSNVNQLVSLFAPGANITFSSATGADLGAYNGVAYGTSFASAYVAGAAAVLRAKFPSDAQDVIGMRMKNTGTAVVDGTVTKPRLDLAAATTTSCVYSASISGSSVGTNGGVDSLSVTVTAPTGCAWSPVFAGVSGASVFLAVGTNAATGTGSDTFTISASGNPTKSDRSNTVTVAGQVFTISQAKDLVAPTGNLVVVGDTTSVDPTEKESHSVALSTGTGGIVLGANVDLDGETNDELFQIVDGNGDPVVPEITITTLVNGTLGMADGYSLSDDFTVFFSDPAPAGSSIVYQRRATREYVTTDSNPATPAIEGVLPTIIIDGSDPGSATGKPAQYCFSNSTGGCATNATAGTGTTGWVTWSGSTALGLSNWALVSGENKKTVYLYVRDAAGNTSSTNKKVIVDVNKPSNGTLTLTAGNGQTTVSYAGATDAGSGVFSPFVYRTTTAANATAANCAACAADPTVGNCGIAQPNWAFSGIAWSFVDSAPNGTATTPITYYYRVCAMDFVDRVSDGAANNATPKADYTAPKCSDASIGLDVSADDGAAYATDTTAPITVSVRIEGIDQDGPSDTATDNAVASYCVSSSPLTDTLCTTGTASASLIKYTAWPTTPADNQQGVELSAGETDDITCDAGTFISSVDFASYGDPPSGEFPSFALPGCSSSNSLSAVQEQCLGKDTCSLTADPTGPAASGSDFGDPECASDEGLTVVVTCTAYASVPSLQLAAGEGAKKVYVLLKDNYGNVSASCEDTIIVDTAAPTAPALTATAGVAKNSLSFGAGSDSGSGITRYDVYVRSGSSSTVSAPPCPVRPGTPDNTAGTADDNDVLVYTWTAPFTGGNALPTSAVPYEHTGLTNGSYYAYRLCATDGSGKSTGSTKTAQPKAELSKPVLTAVVIDSKSPANENALWTKSSTIDLNIIATDIDADEPTADPCGATDTASTAACEMCIQVLPATSSVSIANCEAGSTPTGGTTTGWIPFDGVNRDTSIGSATTKRAIYVYVRDLAGNLSARKSAFITLDNIAPPLATITTTALTTGHDIKLSWTRSVDKGIGLPVTGLAPSAALLDADSADVTSYNAPKAMRLLAREDVQPSASDCTAAVADPTTEIWEAEGNTTTTNYTFTHTAPTSTGEKWFFALCVRDRLNNVSILRTGRTTK